MLLVDRRHASRPDSSERELSERALRGLRYSHEDAGGIIEDLDPNWGCYCHPNTATAEPQGLILPLRKAVSRPGNSRACHQCQIRRAAAKYKRDCHVYTFFIV